MPANVWNINFLNLNSQRAYPLYERASRVDTSGGFTLPDEVLLGLYLPVHAGLNVRQDRFYLQSITIFSVGMYVVVGYDDGTSSPPAVATATVPFDGHERYDAYALVGRDDYDDIVGSISVGDLDVIRSTDPGQYFFTLDTGRLDLDCIRPFIRGVSAIVVLNGNEESARLYGDIRLQAGERIRLSTSVVGDIQNIRIDALDGVGLNEEEINTAVPIYAINGVAPDESGNFTLEGTSCLTLSELANGLKFDDKCAKPCEGCEALERITRDLQSMRDGANTLQAYMSRMEGQMDALCMSVLASRGASCG